MYVLISTKRPTVIEPVAHTVRCHQHDQRQSRRDDERLADVQYVQRHLHAYRSPFIPRQSTVVARRLMRLVAEILHRLEVQQAVERLGGGVVVVLVHRAPRPHAPAGEAHGEADIADHGDERHRGEPPVEQAPDDRGDQQQLDQCRHHVEHREPQHGLDAGGAAIDRTRQCAGLAIQMEAQAQRMQMAERAQRRDTHRALLHGREQRITQLPKSGGRDAQQAIADDQPQRHRQHRGAILRRQRIDDAAIDDRHVHRRDLGQHQHHCRRHDAHPRAGIVGRPQIWQQRTNRAHGGALRTWQNRRGNLAWRGYASSPGMWHGFRRFERRYHGGPGDRRLPAPRSRMQQRAPPRRAAAVPYRRRRVSAG